VDLAEVEALFEEHGHGNLRLVDNGITERRSETLTPEVLHTYHLIPRAAGKANAVAVHMRRRNLRRDETIAIGDSRGDLEVASVVGRFYLVANAVAKDPAVREAIPAGAEVTVTEESMTGGFYEAIVRSLAEG
jgi:phosphoglycolate phosphatase